jgi:DNA helicase HerA-like ATPase
MDAVSQEDSTAKWNLLNSLEQLDESGLFSQDAMELEDLLEPGEATVVNLRAVEPETAEMTMFMLAKRMFQLRKENRIPPYIMVIEEAHNFAPEKGFGKALSSEILRKIASEGRKFGLGIGVISQRPARIDKNVLSQANTQFILRVTNPNDLKAISKSFEGITSEVEGMIKSLPPGVSFVLGNEYPVMTDVRTRKSKHGGTTQTADTYTEKEDITVFEPRKSLQEVETEKGEKYDVAYMPLYLVEDEEEKALYDAVNGQKKAEISKVSGKEKEALSHLEDGLNKSEIMEEMDITLSKVTSLVQSLREKDRVKQDSTELKQSIFDNPTVDERVAAEKLIEIEKQPEELGIGSEKVVYYPYYSKGEDVYDPILGQEI